MHPSDYLWWAGNDVADVDGLRKPTSVASSHIGGADVAPCSEELAYNMHLLASYPYPLYWSEYLQHSKSYYVAHTQINYVRIALSSAY